MKKTFRLMALVAVSTVILASCAQRDLGLSPLVPADALGFVQITDPEKFITNADAFIQPLGITAMTGNLGVKDLLSLGLKSGAKLDLTALDLKKPLGFAVLAPSGDSKDVRIILYVPLVKPEESSPKIEEMLKKVPNMNATIVNGYGIYYNGPKQTFPPAKGLAIPESLTFDPGAITAYADVNSILSHYKTEYDAAKKDALSEIENSEQSMQGSSALNANMGTASASIVNEFFKAVDQTRSFAFHLKVDGSGLGSSSTVEFSGDGNIAKLIKDIGPGKNIAALTKYIPASYLFSGASSLNPLAFKDLNKTMMDLYFSALKIDDTTKAAISALIEESFKLAGKNSAFSFDLGVDPKITQTSEQDFVANLPSLFSIKSVAVTDVTNGDEYQKFLVSSIQNGAVSNYINKLLEPSGFSLKMKLDDAKDGDFSWKELKFSLEVGNMDKIDLTNPEARSLATATAGILQKFTVSIAVKNNKAYVVIGDNASDTLKKLAADDAVDTSVVKNEHWMDWLKTVPADAQFIGNLSLARILDIVKVATKNGVAVEIPEADKSGIFTWVRATANRVDSSTFWALKEMVPIVKEGMKDSANLMNMFSGDATGSSGASGGAMPGSESDMTMPGDSGNGAETGTTENSSSVQ